MATLDKHAKFKEFLDEIRTAGWTPEDLEDVIETETEIVIERPHDDEDTE